MKDRKVKGLERIKSMHSTKQRSIPRAQQSSEIELFLLEKEKERFVKEAERLQIRLRTVYERIAVLNKEIEEYQKLRWQKQLEQQPEQETLEDIQELITHNMKLSKELEEGEWKMKKLMY